jgi:serine/threonine protein kinase
VFKRKQFKIKFFIESEFTYDALSKSNYGLWFHIIQLHDIPDIESRVAHYMSKFNILGYARDEHGRIAVNVATQVNRVAIQSEYLWHGRYRILESRPQHVSKTCLVYRGVDEEDLNEIGDPKPIALKLMVHKTHFHKELTARQHDFDSGFIMDISNHFPDSSESSYASMPEVCGFDIENVIRMTKLQAEQLYCVALPYAERNMFVAMKQERFAGSNMDEVAHVFSQIVKCVEHMHSFGLIHGDLKPLNIVRVGAHWKLIDLDATSKIGVEVHLSKFSSAYIPPESIFIDPDSGMASVKKPRKIATTEAELIDMKYESRDKYARVADPSFDVWSLGCILYQLCNEEVRPLFFAGQDDNLNINSKGENSLYALGCWTTELKNKKMKKITDPVARNLISQMLMKDPKDRPTVSRVLSHPFISKKKISRFVGEEAEYDVFISYRVNSDCHHAEQLYNGLTKRGLKVWWDKVSLEPGVPWKEGFCDGLSNAKTFVCLLSRNAINHSENFNQNFGMLSEDSDVDNMYLEIRLATEFVALGLIDRIFPVMIGDSEDDYVTYMDNFFRVDSSTYNSPCAPYLPQECPKLVEDEVLVEMERQAMGIPLRIGPTVAEIMHDIFNYQGVFITGERNKAFDNVECKIETMLGAICADAIKVDTEQCENDDVKSMHTSNVPSSASSRIVAVHRANIEEKEQIIESLQEEIDKLKAQLKAPSE